MYAELAKITEKQSNATKNIETLFGDVELLKGPLPTSGVLGLYFSAHWCPPCRGFTPQLIEIYKNLKEAGDKPFEIIFISSDRDHKQFDSYFAEMPWLALPFGQVDLKEKLSQKFEVSGIPTLVLLDANTGAVITADGRAALSKDPAGEKYPWAEQAITSPPSSDPLKLPSTSTPHIQLAQQPKVFEHSEVGMQTVTAALFFPVCCATVCLLIVSLPYLVVAAVKGPGTEFCGGYWQNSTTTTMRAEIGGRVRRAWQSCRRPRD